MKRWLALLLALLLLPLSGALCRAEETSAAEDRPYRYSGKMRLSARVYAGWSMTKGVDQIGTIPQKAYVQIHAYTPDFAYVTYPQGNVTGYVKRVCIQDIKVRGQQNIPPFGVEFNRFIAFVSAQDAPVTDTPGGGKTLVTLHQGCRVSLIGFENGYAKLIYHRQYGYIDSNLLAEALPVYRDPEAAGTDAPIAAYTSFYKLTTDESNQNRIVNLKVACDRMAALRFEPGDKLDFNAQVGPYSKRNGYLPAGTLSNEQVSTGYGGGTCQVSSTLYNVVLQLPGLTVLYRRAHGDNGASYLPIHMDAAVGNSSLNFKFRNDYSFPVRIEGTVQDRALTIAIYRAE